MNISVEELAEWKRLGLISEENYDKICEDEDIACFQQGTFDDYYEVDEDWYQENVGL